MIKYQKPASWLQYDPRQIINELTDAKAAVISLTTMPYQRSWIEALQEVQLKREVAGTSRIEGADFTETELDEALKEHPAELLTRSQRQAHAAILTYRWIAKLPKDFPLDANLICEVHRKIVTGADDDHCEPGRLRQRDQNVIFGLPPHRGVDGGEACEAAFASLCTALGREFKDHDLLIQALALHYHFGAMHPFLDGNGRTARAVEALMLQRAGLRDALFIAMSNYYYDEKTTYLQMLSEVRAKGHDLTAFLKFGLKGIAIQSRRLFTEIRTNVSKALFRNMMFDLFNRLRTDRKRIIAKRQMEILKLLLDENEMEYSLLVKKMLGYYSSLKNPRKAISRDVGYLQGLGALDWHEEKGLYRIFIRLEWPTEITETRFFEWARKLPEAKPHSFGL